MNDNGERKMTTFALMKRSKQNDKRFLEEEEEMSLDEWCCKLPYTHSVNKELRELRGRANNRHDAKVIADALEVILSIAKHGESSYMIETLEGNIAVLRKRAEEEQQ